MSVLFCDSNCELWYTTLRELPLKLIKMPYTIEGKEYFYDMGEATDFEGYYKLMRNKAKAITSALNTYDYIEYFEPWFKKGEDILYISFSHKLSSTFESMQNAVSELLEKYPGRKFEVFDTKSISVGAGLLVYYAGILKRDGASDEEIVGKLAELRQKLNVYFAVDDLNHLKRGGRLSGVAAFAGTLLNLKPVLTVDEEGALKPVAKVKGRKLVMNYFMEKLRAEHVDEEKIAFVVGADCKEDVEELSERISKEYPKLKIVKQIVGPVIATHCGPGTLGLIFVSK